MELPDFDELFAVSEQIKELAIEKGYVDLEIELLQGEITRKAVADEKYFVNGKPPSQSFISSTYAVTGFDGELVPLKKKFIELAANLDYLKARFSVMQMMVNVYQTDSANKRAGLV